MYMIYQKLASRTEDLFFVLSAAGLKPVKSLWDVKGELGPK